MSRQNEYNDLIDLIHRHYSVEQIEEYKSYSTMGVKESQELKVTVNTNSYGH